MLGFVFIAGAAIIVNTQVTDGGLGLLGMAAATGLAYALMVYAFCPISGGHINPAITIGEMFAAQRLLDRGAHHGPGRRAVLSALALEVAFRDFVGDAAAAASLSFNPR
jgi:glycerol uptake facilitator-like aquaporin